MLLVWKLPGDKSPKCKECIQVFKNAIKAARDDGIDDDLYSAGTKAISFIKDPKIRTFWEEVDLNFLKIGNVGYWDLKEPNMGEIDGRAVLINP